MAQNYKSTSSATAYRCFERLPQSLRTAKAVKDNLVFAKTCLTKLEAVLVQTDNASYYTKIERVWKVETCITTITLEASLPRTAAPKDGATNTSTEVVGRVWVVCNELLPSLRDSH